MKDGTLRIWHIPQVPMDSFCRIVKSVDEARTVLKILADYDHFQFIHKVKPDYSNSQGLEIFTDGEWTEWEDGDGNDIRYSVELDG